MKTNQLDIFVLRFNRIIIKLASIEKKRVFSINGITLTMQQIHLIDTIGRLSGANITEISKTLAVTKGAVSQKLSWLEKRNFIIKTKKEGNNLETFVELTKHGLEAFDLHEKYHKKFDSDMFRFLEDISDNNANFLNEVLDRIEKSFEQVSEIDTLTIT